MNIFNHPDMRRRIILISVLTLTACCIASTPAAGKRLSDKAVSSTVSTFFTQVLQRQDEAVLHSREAFVNPQQEQFTLPLNKPLKAKDIDRMSSLIWSAWCKANIHLASTGHDGLPPLCPLAGSTASVWTLPSSLEPEATLSFYWGWKGAEADTVRNALPLFLYLHGSGPRDREWATGKQLATQFDDAPSIYFIPRIPNEGSYYRWWQLAKQYAWERLLRLALCDPKVDAYRLYVFGISEGGYGSQRLASFYADYWAAAGPMAGGEPLRNAPAENCANIGFSLLTGERDTGFYRNVLTRRAKEVFDSLQRMTKVVDGDSTLFIHRIELQKGRGHGIDYRPDTPWLKTFRRNPWPKHIMWEDFAMDGRHRRAFYNISVEKRPEEDEEARTAYTMDIVGDTVRLSVSNVAYTVTERDPDWGIELKTAKQYSPARGGKIKIFLNQHLVNLEKKVVVTVNGAVRYEGRPTVTAGNLIESCLLWGDPMRLFPASVLISY